MNPTDKIELPDGWEYHGSSLCLRQTAQENPLYRHVGFTCAHDPGDPWQARMLWIALRLDDVRGWLPYLWMAGDVAPLSDVTGPLFETCAQACTWCLISNTINRKAGV